MVDLLQALDTHREAILLGEIGALLHMFGKCSSEFLIANSLKGGAKDSHQDLKHLPTLTPHLKNTMLRNAFSFILDNHGETLAGDFTDFITKYKRDKPDCILLCLFNTCHRMTSADEKGVVRRNQSIQDMWISTPFGHQAHRIDLDDVEKMRNQMDRQLGNAFQSYLSGINSIQELHEQVIRILKPCLSIALGETRLPANDVTLWAQSHGVASLYKPVLATLAMGFDPCPRKPNSNDFDYNNVRWRLFGIGWNGLGFIQRGRKPSDILSRQEILRDIGRDIQSLLEIRYPVGNRFYVDINGLFFTFPGLGDDEAVDLVKQLAPELVRIVRNSSQDEIWPFFTLSKPHRTLTVITKEMDVRNQIASVPKVSSFLSVDQDAEGRRESLLVGGPAMAGPAKGQDICPVCQVRSKMVREEACDTCEKRRSGRQRNWQANRNEQTIWVDEVADKNNRIALLTLRFDLSRWLSGEWLTTHLSQTFSDWFDSERMKRVLNNNQQRQKLEGIVSPVTPTKEAITNILGHVGTGDVTRDVGFKTAALNTFFEDVKAAESKNEPNYIVAFLENFRGRINDSPGYNMTAENLATAVFTQNPSPARLARIWEETKTFLDNWLAGIKDELLVVRHERLGFTTTAAIPGVHEGQTYRIAVPNLLPSPLVVLCLNKSARDYLTVESLKNFRFKQEGDRYLSGLPAVQCALEENGIQSWLDEATGMQTAAKTSSTVVQRDEFRVEPYLPFIVLVRSPVYYQVLLPADRIPDVLRLLLAHASERFCLVEGKLPLHVGLLVSKRKFPLYALIGGGRQVLDNPFFQNGISEIPWWSMSDQANNPFYGQYPSRAPDEGGHNLADLDQVDVAKRFWLTPGYFDFDFLGSTADIHRLSYELNEEGQPVRPFISYGHIAPRPFYLHRLKTLFDIWDPLTTHLGSTQRHHLEEAMTTKLEQWKTIKDNSISVFNSFAKAVLHNSFGNRWKELNEKKRDLLERSAEDGLLLEALERFQHVLKGDTSNE